MRAAGRVGWWLAVLASAVGPALAADEHEHHHHEAALLGVPDSRDGSGTAWEPDATPLFGIHLAHGTWMTMAHGNLFAGYQHEGSDRGDAQWIAPHWGMLMEQRPVGTGKLVLRQMLTLEPVTLRPEGYPLLLQTGESFDGSAIHDRQHPHDLFMELAGAYSRELTRSLALQLYAAPVGEPALGPVAFPHRLSAFSDPIAPRGHHWQDSTHVSFGVLTAGVFTRSVKVEASWFNGREPDEHRYNFDFHELDSYSGRVSFNPSASWSFQASYGFLARPEELAPDESVHRLTASAALHRGFAERGWLAATAVYGRNDPSGEPTTAAWLLEANLDTGNRNTWFGRFEHVDKTGRDLVLPAPLEGEVFASTCLSAGYVRDFKTTKRLTLGAGVRVAVSWIEGGLEPFYGTDTPSGYTLFLHVHPVAAMGHGSTM